MRLEFEVDYIHNLYEPSEHEDSPYVCHSSHGDSTFIGFGSRYSVKDRTKALLYLDLEFKESSCTEKVNVLTLNLDRETALAMATYIQQYYANEI